MTKIELEYMFLISGISRQKFYTALRTMGKKYLKVGKDKWTADRPTTGYCYVVSELVYHYSNIRTQPYTLTHTDGGTHWFLKTKSTGEIIDLTADQIDGDFDYDSGIRRSFLTKQISKRGRILAQLLGLENTDEVKI